MIKFSSSYLALVLLAALVRTRKQRPTRQASLASDATSQQVATPMEQRT